MDAATTSPLEGKLYLTAEEAAAYVGIGVNAMREYVNSADPPPMLRVGKRDFRIQRARLADYMERKQEVRWVG